MKLFKLTPYEDKMDDKKWEISTYNKPIVIEAANEDDARDIADKSCRKAKTPKKVGEEILQTSWLFSDLVECCELKDSLYSLKGKEMVHDPAHLDRNYLDQL